MTVGAPNGSPSPPPDATLELRVFAEGDAVVLEARNAGDQPVRLWRQTNSWGWSMPRLSVGDALLKPVEKIWTRNVPDAAELAPGESARYALRAGDFDPDALAAVRDLRDRPLRVQGCLVSEPSAQAVEHRVWCGTVRSAEQDLAPPHRWM